jgi:outer membrane protein TolC
VLAGLFASAVSGCAVGPNFSPAPAPPVDTYLPGKLATPDGGKGGPRIAPQHFVTGADVSARWWAAFQSPALDDLVRQSVEYNPTLQSAEGAITTTTRWPSAACFFRKSRAIRHPLNF